MSERDSVQSLLVLRKLTRAIGDAVRTQVTEYLTTLTPLFRPERVLGESILGGAKESTRRTEQTVKDVHALYDAIAPSKPFNLRRELSPPFDFARATLEITPVDYMHVVQSGAETRHIKIRRPLVWTLSYTGYAPPRLKDLLDQRVRSDELQRFILSHLILQQVTTHHPGLVGMLAALHFPVTTAKSAELGELPVTRIGVDISTERPPDTVVVETAELTGIDAFEEVVNVSEISRLRDPLKEQLLGIVRQHVPEFVAS